MERKEFLKTTILGLVGFAIPPKKAVLKPPELILPKPILVEPGEVRREVEVMATSNCTRTQIWYCGEETEIRYAFAGVGPKRTERRYLGSENIPPCHHSLKDT